MKFNITATSGLFYGFDFNNEKHRKYVRILNNYNCNKRDFYNENSNLEDVTIEIKSLDELMNLINEINERIIIIPKGYYSNSDEDGNPTIEIYDDFRE